MQKLLMIIAMICSLLLVFTNAKKSYKWYKKYLIDIFEYNKGRGYRTVWENDLHKCYTHLTWAVVFTCLSYIIYHCI